LSEKTKAEKKRNNYGDKILQREGQLYASLANNSTNDTAMVGTNKTYAKLHHFGGEVENPGGVKFIILKDKFIPLKKDAKKFMGITKPFTFSMPERPFMELNEADINGVQNTIKKYLKPA
jgi:phage gpG-like protein